MRFVSPLLKHVVYPSLAATGYLRSISRPGLAVITYHGVLPENYKPIDSGFDGSLITADSFRRQLRLLKRNYIPITPDEMLSWCRGERDLPPRAALLTCDDGFLNSVTEMLPILQEEELRCLFFVTGASTGERRSMLWHEELLLMFLRAPAGNFKIGAADIELEGVLEGVEQRRVLWWNVVKRLSQVDAGSRELFLQAAHSQFGLSRSLDYYLEHYPETQRHFCLLTRAELQQLAAAGMTVGAHTMTHSILSEMPADLAWAEIVECRARLEALIGKPVWAFAYPFGNASSVSPSVLAMVKRAGFVAAFMNVGGGLGSDLPLHAIPRVHVNADTGLAEFEAHVSGLYESLRRGAGRHRSANQPVLEIARPAVVAPERVTAQKTG